MSQNILIVPVHSVPDLIGNFGFFSRDLVPHLGPLTAIRQWRETESDPESGLHLAK
jgi:hypothetical protein